VEEDLSEDDVSVKFITPAIVQAGWDEATQIRRQVSFTKGRIIVRGGWWPEAKPRRRTSSSTGGTFRWR
jgi:type I restriction enzyme R subunit